MKFGTKVDSSDECRNISLTTLTTVWKKKRSNMGQLEFIFSPISQGSASLQAIHDTTDIRPIALKYCGRLSCMEKIKIQQLQ